MGRALGRSLGGKKEGAVGIGRGGRIPWAFALSGLAAGAVLAGAAVVAPPSWRATAVVRGPAEGLSRIAAVSGPVEATAGPKADQWVVSAEGKTRQEALGALHKALSSLLSQGGKQGFDTPRDQEKRRMRHALERIRAQILELLGSLPRESARTEPAPEVPDPSVAQLESLRKDLEASLPPNHPWIRRVESEIEALRALETNPGIEGLTLTQYRLLERLPPDDGRTARLRLTLGGGQPRLTLSDPGQQDVGDSVRASLEQLAAEIAPYLETPPPSPAESPPRFSLVQPPKAVPLGRDQAFRYAGAVAVLTFGAALGAPRRRDLVLDAASLPPGPWVGFVEEVPTLSTREAAKVAVGRWVLGTVPWVFTLGVALRYVG